MTRRCATADNVAVWVKEVHAPDRQNGPDRVSKRSFPSIKSIPSIKSTYPEIAANAALVLIGVACALLSRQIATLEKNFVDEGGSTERLYRVRNQRRNSRP